MNRLLDANTRRPAVDPLLTVVARQSSPSVRELAGAARSARHRRSTRSWRRDGPERSRVETWELVTGHIAISKERELADRQKRSLVLVSIDALRFAR